MFIRLVAILFLLLSVTCSYADTKVYGDFPRSIKIFQLAASSIKGAGSAVLTDSGLGTVLVFEDAKSDTVFADIAMPTDMDKNTAPKIRIGWSTPATSGNVKWQMEYVYRSLSEGTSTVTPDATITVVTAASGSANGYVISELAMVAPVLADRIVITRITRLGADAADTCAASAHMVGVVFEYTADKFGG